MTSKSTLVLALAVATAGIALAQDATPSRDHALATALIARSPHTSIPPEMDMFAPLLGSWEIQGTEWPEPGKPKKTTVKVAFGRVLGGRAIQDVWAFSEPGGAAEPTLGTTLRLYDPVERVWRITWLDPSSRLRLQLTARKLTAIVAAHHFDGVPNFDQHHTTSFAKLTIFMNFLSRSSRATAPKMRVPRGLLSLSMITTALLSKRM